MITRSKITPHKVNKMNQDFVLKEANLKEEEGQIVLALKLYHQILSENKMHVQAHLGVGRCALVLGHVNKAYEHFSLVLIQTRALPAAFWGRGLALLELGEPSHGKNDILKAIELDTPPSSLRIDCAAALNEYGFFEDALFSLQAVLEKDKDDDYWIEWCFARYALGFTCELDFDSIFQESLNEPIVMMFRAKQLLIHNSCDPKAKSMLDKALHLEPDLIDKFKLLGF